MEQQETNILAEGQFTEFGDKQQEIAAAYSLYLAEGQISGELLVVLREVLRTLSFRAKTFGIYDREDLEQESWLILLDRDLLRKFSDRRGRLQNFLAVSILNRLRNLKRNYYLKSDKKRPFNQTASLSDEIVSFLLDSEKSPEETASLSDIAKLCEDNLSGRDRLTYLRLKEGQEVSRKDFSFLVGAVRQLLKVVNDDQSKSGEKEDTKCP